jgi:SRSO17 transposase
MSAHAIHHAQLLERPVYADSNERLVSIEALSARLFRRRDWQRRAAQYLQALLAAPPIRCNAEQLAAVVGANPRAFQRFLSEALWDHRRVIDTLQGFVEPYLNSPDGIWVLEEIGFTKQGNKSVGVARQHNPTLGKRDNCQIGVFLGYASALGHALVDTRLYLPQSWINNRPRCQAADVPDIVTYQSQGDIALDMLRAATERGHVHSRWVTGTSTFGWTSSFRDRLDAGGWWYMLEVPLSLGVAVTPAVSAEPYLMRGNRRIDLSRGRPLAPDVKMISTLAARLSPAAWQSVHMEVEGVPQSAHTCHYAAMRVCEWRKWELGSACWLVLCRNKEGGDLVAALSNAPGAIAPDLLGRVSAMHRSSMLTLATQSRRLGLVEYETRSWRGWHGHMTLCLLAGALLLQLEHPLDGNDATCVLSATYLEEAAR